MALRNQPYIPLYIQDFMTDEKLAECSAMSTGVFIRIMCLMHKQETYGKILLKQKFKQTQNICLDFASQLAKHFPYPQEEIQLAIDELTTEGVLVFEDDYMVQKRMVKDGKISDSRTSSGSKGGKKTQGKIQGSANDFASPFAKANIKANTQANSEYEDENVNENTVNNSSVLTQLEIQNTIEFLSRLSQINLTDLQVSNFWKAFLIHTENEPPVPRSRQINHFRNWLKKQDHATAKRTTDSARPGTILSPL